MSPLLKAISWKLILVLCMLLLAVLIVFNFYGLYTARFYFLKIDNYIFPLIAIIHFKYIQVLWLKIRERGYPDSKIRNLEYALYPVLLIYAYKASETAYILFTASNYDGTLIPQNFLSMGLTVVGMYLVLVLLTFISFSHRKRKVGAYNFDKINENIDSWQ